MSDLTARARRILDDLADAPAGSYLLTISTLFSDIDADHHQITVPFTAPAGLDARWTRRVLPYLSHALVHDGYLLLAGHFGQKPGRAEWSIRSGHLYPESYHDRLLAWPLASEPVGPERYTRNPDMANELEQEGSGDTSEIEELFGLGTEDASYSPSGLLVQAIKEDLLSRYGQYAERILRTILDGAPRGVAELRVYRSRYYVLEHEDQYDASYPVFIDEHGFHLPPGAWEDLLETTSVVIDYNGEFVLRHAVKDHYVEATWYVFDQHFAPESAEESGTSSEQLHHLRWATDAWGESFDIPANNGAQVPID